MGVDNSNLRHEIWVHWFDRFKNHPELNDIRLKVMLTLVVVNPPPSKITHSELQSLFNLTDKTIRGLRKTLESKGWTKEVFKDRNITICATDKAKDLFQDFIVDITIPRLMYGDE